MPPKTLSGCGESGGGGGGGGGGGFGGGGGEGEEEEEKQQQQQLDKTSGPSETSALALRKLGLVVYIIYLRSKTQACAMEDLVPYAF